MEREILISPHLTKSKKSYSPIVLLIICNRYFKLLSLLRRWRFLACKKPNRDANHGSLRGMDHSVFAWKSASLAIYTYVYMQCFLLPAVSLCFAQIQSRIWTCRQAYTTVSCHCGVIVREGNDVLSIDQCFWQQRDPQSKIRNIPPRVRKHSKGSLQEGFGVYKNPSGTQFKVGIYYIEPLCAWYTR